VEVTSFDIVLQVAAWHVAVAEFWSRYRIPGATGAGRQDGAEGQSQCHDRFEQVAAPVSG
jgi:hypothetical protein